MTQDVKKPRGRTGASQKNDQLSGGSEDSMAHRVLPRVAAHVNVVVGRGQRSRRVLTVRCPRCHRRHSHLWPWHQAEPGQRSTPCGLRYTLVALGGDVA